MQQNGAAVDKEIYLHSKRNYTLYSGELGISKLVLLVFVIIQVFNSNCDYLSFY